LRLSSALEVDLLMAWCFAQKRPNHALSPATSCVLRAEALFALSLRRVTFCLSPSSLLVHAGSGLAASEPRGVCVGRTIASCFGDPCS
jgi:hypothetical protein